MKLFDVGVYSFPTREDDKLPFSVSREENRQNGANLSHVDHPASEIDASSIPAFLLPCLP